MTNNQTYFSGLFRAVLQDWLFEPFKYPERATTSEITEIKYRNTLQLFSNYKNHFQWIWFSYLYCNDFSNRGRYFWVIRYVFWNKLQDAMASEDGEYFNLINNTIMWINTGVYRSKVSLEMWQKKRLHHILFPCLEKFLDLNFKGKWKHRPPFS